MYEKYLESFTCISYYEKGFQNLFCRKISGFSKKKIQFLNARSFEPIFWSIENVKLSKPDFLPNLIGSLIAVQSIKFVKVF